MSNLWTVICAFKSVLYIVCGVDILTLSAGFVIFEHR